MTQGEFVEIVPPMPLEQADAEFTAWLRLRGLGREDVDPDDIRMDLIRAEGGRTLRRYLIRRASDGER